MGLFSWIGEKVSAAVDWVTDKASSAWEATKNVAKKVVDTCVDVGQKVVDTAQKVYEAAKKVVEKTVVKKVAPIVKTAAQIAKETIGRYYPWVATVADAVIKGIEYIEKIHNHPLVKKITKHIEWALEKTKLFLDKAKKIKDFLFGKSEEREAMQRQKELQEAMNLMQTEEQRKSIRFAMVINSYLMVRSRLQETLDEFDVRENTNFDHYLRLRATQRLLWLTEQRL